MPTTKHARYTPLPTSIHTLVERTPNAILLETSRFDAHNHHSYLFLNPTRILTANTPEEIPALFTNIEATLAEGLHLAGYLSYECNAHFEPTLRVPHSYAASSRMSGEAEAPNPTTLPLAYLAAYSAPVIFDHATGTFLNPTPQRNSVILSEAPEQAQRVEGAQPKGPNTLDHATTFRPFQPEPLTPTAPILTNPNLRIPTPDYLAAIKKIQAYISAGDTYQVNFTDAIAFPTTLSPATLFTTLSQNQSVAYAAYLNLGPQQILSFSPELFFQTDTSTNKITTRPMKGTMPRGLDTIEDEQAAQRLQRDEKNRAEHVMIVDLLRNDLGRISLPGSVHVYDLFSIERYQTLHQMTSTISATLRPNTTFYDIFAAMFPCGSVTGAPKIRTMQIIRELEAHPRGVYTGAIGFIAPNRSATFSVPIRTLVLEQGIATMGVGGGIVADSVPEDEHREALLKASFLTRTHQTFELIETLLYDQHFARLPLHLDRLESSAHYFDFPCDRTAIEAQLRAFAHFLDPRQPHRVRLLLSSTGEATITAQPLEPTKDRVPHSYAASSRMSGNEESQQPTPPSPSAQDPHSYAALSRMSGNEESQQPTPPSPSAQDPHSYAALSRMSGNEESQQPTPPSQSAQDPHSYAALSRVSGNEESHEPSPPSPSAQDITVTLSPHRTNSADLFLRHKTTHRRLYNDELTRARAEGFDEVLFLNERNELTEGAISNLFIEQPAAPQGAGKFLTPPLTSGVLPGVMRRHLLETLPQAEERTLTLADLQPPNTLWLCNSVRGLRKALLRLDPG